MRWVGHEARMGEMRIAYSTSEELGVDGKIISEWFFVE
jgi:hypothetical protein